MRDCEADEALVHDMGGIADAERIAHAHQESGDTGLV